MKKDKIPSDQAIINTWMENIERGLSVFHHELGGGSYIKMFKPTGRANVFEFETAYGVFTATFERKKEKQSNDR